jgi:hypothetical protein
MFDYADIGDFFNNLESHGVSGPVVLDVYDDGGPFTTKRSYALGSDYQYPQLPLFVSRPVNGLSASNPLTIRAAPDETPEILGGAVAVDTAYLLGGSGVLAFENVSYTTVEGLTIRSNQASGILWCEAGTGTTEHIRIASCRIFDVIFAIEVAVNGGDARVDNGIIENNMI